MVKFVLDLAVKRLAALRSKADKQTKELILKIIYYEKIFVRVK